MSGGRSLSPLSGLCYSFGMGLGVYFTTALPEPSGGARESNPGAILGQIAAIAEQAAQELGAPIADTFWSHQDGARLFLHFIPFEEDVEVCEEDGALVVSAKTSGAGPGYHEFVVDLLYELQAKLGLQFQAPLGEDGDDTGFFQNRDRAVLRAAMATQLAQLARVVLESVGQGALLNMSLDFRPEVRGFAASPLGEWSKEWIEETAWAKGDATLARAQEYFPWWERGISGDDLVKFGLACAWTEVHWVAPQTEAEEKAIQTALTCFDLAKQRKRPVPEKEYDELRTLLTDAADGMEIAPSPEGMGFRRRSVTINLGAGWEIQVPGYYHHTMEQNGEVFVFWFGDRTIRATTFTFEAEDSSPEALKSLVRRESRDPELDGLPQGMVGAFVHTQDEEEGCAVTNVSLATPGNLCTLTFAYGNPEDSAWALTTARSVRHQGEG